jgi:hypothetical protein
MKSRIRTPYLGVFVLIAGAALCAPQVAAALPGHSAAASVSVAATKFPGCRPNLKASGTEATVKPVDCPEGAFLVSYSADSLSVGNDIHQTLFRQGVHSVELPPCFWQVDFVTEGAVLPVIDSNHRYTKLGRFIAGKIGGEACPTTTTTTVAPSTTTTEATTTTTEATTTTTEATTTTTEATTTTTGATTTTTTVGSTTTTTSTPGPTVLGTSIVPPTTAHTDGGPTTAAAQVQGLQTLPRTGAPHVGMEAVMGLGLMALGGGILVADRRRRRVTA